MRDGQSGWGKGGAKKWDEMRADAVALTTRREDGPRVLQKTTKEDRVTSYGSGFARSSKSRGQGDRGRLEGGEATFKVRGVLRAGLSFAGGDNRESPRRTTGGTAVSCVFVPIYIKVALHKRRCALTRIPRMLHAMLRRFDRL